MENKKSRFFSVMCIGNNPKDIMARYDMNATVEPYIKYKYLDAAKYRKTTIDIQNRLLKEFDKSGLDERIKNAIEQRLQLLNQMSDFEYYKELTNGLFYDADGNALCDQNPNGKWKTCHIGRNFSIPLKTVDGKEVYSASNKDVDWSQMHMAHQDVYAAAWEMVMEGREPQTKEEVTIYHSMGDKQAYFSKFKDKDAYVQYSTAYWNYAYVDEQQGWIDIHSTPNEFDWINGYYDRFVKPLKEDDMVTIFECTIETVND